MLEASLGKLPKRIVEATDISCHAKSSAIPVDLAMRALQFGVLKIAFSVLPRMLQQFVKAEVYEVAERGLAYFAGKRALQKIPAVGTILGIIIGGLHSVDYNRTLERRIRGVLGCKASQSDIVPMRKQINDLVTKMKERKAKQPRPSGPVRTRHK